MQQLLKRAIDMVVSGVSLLLLLPFLGVISVLVYLSSRGPVLFRQGRLGRNGVPFNILKFRSMVVNAPDLRNEDGSTFNGENDPRVTWIGKLLRSSSLDELPQLINVFAGDMSLVGPRPDQVDQLRYYSEKERQKLTVKPGITGLAQISGRNSIRWETRKQLDLEYVRRQSLALDLQIMVRTVPYVLFRKGVFVTPNQQHTERR